MPLNARVSKLLAAAMAGLFLAGCSIGGTPGGKEREKFVPPAPPQPYVPPAPQPVTRRLIILHTNDEHSHLLGFGPESEYPFLPEADGSVSPASIAPRIGRDAKTSGGVVRRQYLVNKIRAEAKDPVLLVSAGDETMGTVFEAAIADAAPDLIALGILGYDFMTLGNHEFDWGPDKLSAEIRMTSNMLFGGAVPILSSNIHFDDVVAGGPGFDLESLYGAGDSGAPIMPWATKTMANGLKVGLLGLMGYDAALVSAGRPPISFSVPKTGKACTLGAPNACAAGESCVQGHCVDPLDAAGHLVAAAADAQPVIDLLRNEKKVDLVVALTHLGIAEDTALAQMTHGIDVIIGGHSHDEVAPTLVASQVGAGQSVIVQAGSYGRKLGQLTLTVDPAGAVAHVPAESTLLAVDRTLDASIYAGTDLTATPPVLSTDFERALQLTGVVIGPVLAGLNARLHPLLGTNLLDEIVTSDHDVVGEVPFKDTNLSQLVTDAEFAILTSGACLDPATRRIVVVEANGVIRDSLRFGSSDHKATFSDVFRVMPLGVSPWEDASVASPGFPVAVFNIAAPELFAGADVGVTKGLQGDSFFLSYSGMRVTYDTALPPVDPVKLHQMATDPTVDPGGRVVKLELGCDGPGPVCPATQWTTIYEYDKTNPQPIWGLRWKNGINPATALFTVVTNLYIAALMSNFGITPKDSTGATLRLPQTVMCQTLAPNPTCNPANPSPAILPCMSLPGGAGLPSPKWIFPEVKEWGALYKFLTSPAALNGTIPSLLYLGDLPAKPRVIPAP